MDKFWKIALGVGGFGTVGSFVFWSLYKEWLSLPIFSKLTNEQTFLLMVLFLVITFFALLSVLSVYLTKQPNDKENAKQDSINSEFGQQLVRWGPVDGKEAGITIGTGIQSKFLSWEYLAKELQARLIPQLEHVPEGCSVSLADFKGKKDWIVRINESEGNEVAHIWFGPNPNDTWKYDGLIRVGLPGSPPLVWQTFQRYTDGSYRGI